jgi:hypothetical protein
MTIPATVWFGGDQRRAIRVRREPAVKGVEIDPDKDFPDIDRSNQAWPR